MKKSIKFLTSILSLGMIFGVTTGCSNPEKETKCTTEETKNYNVTVTAEKNGRVKKYSYGNDAIVIAIPDDGYVLKSWSDGNNESIREMTLTNDISLTATFAKGVEYTSKDDITVRVFNDSVNEIEVKENSGGDVDIKAYYPSPSEVDKKYYPALKWVLSDGSVNYSSSNSIYKKELNSKKIHEITVSSYFYEYYVVAFNDNDVPDEGTIEDITLHKNYVKSWDLSQKALIGNQYGNFHMQVSKKIEMGFGDSSGYFYVYKKFGNRLKSVEILHSAGGLNSMITSNYHLEYGNILLDLSIRHN